MGSESLYDRLGGDEAIDAVVDDFYDRVLADDRISHYFEDADVDDLRDHMTVFIASVTGGPVEYDGRGMTEAHAHLDVTEEHFEVVAEHLSQTLADAGVEADDREDLLSTVAALKPAIVSA